MSLMWMNIYIEVEWPKFNWNEWRIMFEQIIDYIDYFELFEIYLLKCHWIKPLKVDLFYFMRFSIFSLKWKIFTQEKYNFYSDLVFGVILA